MEEGAARIHALCLAIPINRLEEHRAWYITDCNKKRNGARKAGECMQTGGEEKVDSSKWNTTPRKVKCNGLEYALVEVFALRATKGALRRGILPHLTHMPLTRSVLKDCCEHIFVRGYANTFPISQARGMINAPQ